MTDTCTCAPGDCHGGHTINVGPPRLTDEQLRRLMEYVHPDETTDYVRPWLRSMAAELLALRPRVTELEAELEAERSGRVAERAATTDRLASAEGITRDVMRERDDARARVTELEAERDGWQKLSAKWNTRFAQLTAHGADLERRGRELEAAQRADRCQVTTVDPSRPDIRACTAPSCHRTTWSPPPSNGQARWPIMSDTELFLQAGICRACGAHVALTDVHQRWHEELAKTFDSHVNAFEKIIEAAGLRPNRRARRAASKAAHSG